MLVFMELVTLTQEAHSSVKSAYELLENRRGETHREFESHRTRQKLHRPLRGRFAFCLLGQEKRDFPPVLVCLLPLASLGYVLWHFIFGYFSG